MTTKSNNDEYKNEYHFHIINTDKGYLKKGDHVVMFPDGECIMDSAMPAAVDELNRLYKENIRMASVIANQTSALQAAEDILSVVSERQVGIDRKIEDFKNIIFILRSRQLLGNTEPM